MIYTYLELSTGHLTDDTRTQLELTADNPIRIRDTDWPAMSIATYDHGFFVTVPDEKEQDLSGLPDDLAGVMRHAQRAGVSLVRFDSDGDALHSLPFYED